MAELSSLLTFAYGERNIDSGRHWFENQFR